jgi:hypothetical protein
MLYRPAFLLGFAGLLPAIVCVLAAALGPADWQRLAFTTGALYSGLILSFLGGTWWGLATQAKARQATALYTIAVVPTLAALSLMMVLTPWRLVLIGGLIFFTLPFDRMLVKLQLAPSNWLTLRVPLSIGLGLLTIALGLLAR